MKKLINFIAAALVGASAVWLPGVASAQTYTVSQDAITQMQQQIQAIINQLNALSQRLQSLASGQPATTVGVRLTGQLGLGASGENVRVLQQVLASDPTIYPEGLVTGFYGPLTSAAVARFQAKYGVAGETTVGPATFTRINEILQEGAGQSGIVPPGLLNLPNVRARFGVGVTTPPPTVPDTTAPVISVLSPSPMAGGTSARLFWGTNENAMSKVWYATSPLTSDLFGQMLVLAGFVTSNSVDLTSLTPNTTYYYMIVVTDTAGNTATSSQQTFVTAGS